MGDLGGLGDMDDAAKFVVARLPRENVDAILVGDGAVCIKYPSNLVGVGDTLVIALTAFSTANKFCCCFCRKR